MCEFVWLCACVSRLTLAAYQAMGIMDLVAANATDYARIATWLVRDDASREGLRARIRSASRVLYRDDGAVTGWEGALVEAVRRRAAALERLSP